jgi:hypothetical protein
MMSIILNFSMMINIQNEVLTTLVPVPMQRLSCAA